MRRGYSRHPVGSTPSDPDHEAHERVHAWLEQWLTRPDPGGWASCAITQNGFVRILSQPRYPLDISTSQAITLLAQACATPHHTFWSADMSIADAARIDSSRVHGPTQVTDLYLLALGNLLYGEDF